MEKNAHLKLTNTYLYKRMLNIPRIVLLFLCVSFTVPSLAETTTMQLPQLSLSLNNVTIREVFNIIGRCVVIHDAPSFFSLTIKIGSFSLSCDILRISLVYVFATSK